MAGHFSTTTPPKKGKMWKLSNNCFVRSANWKPMRARGHELFAFWPTKTTMASALYFRKKNPEQNQLGLSTTEREKFTPAPGDAFLFSLNCEYLEWKKLTLYWNSFGWQHWNNCGQQQTQACETIQNRSTPTQKNFQLWLFLGLHGKEQKVG